MQSYAGDKFYREFWAKQDINISNLDGRRWRVNDDEIALHQRFSVWKEVASNGLMLINAPEQLLSLEKAELYLEMWGGHPKTTNKRVSVNGKATYQLPDYGSTEGHCVYAYPVIDIEPAHLVNGRNALQFSCDKGRSFWGHYILDNAVLRYVYKRDSLVKKYPDLKDFSAMVNTAAVIFNEKAGLKLNIPKKFEDQIESAEYFAKYAGFDDNGNTRDYDWHGYTFEKQWTHHIGQATKAPFKIEWQTEHIPDQNKPIQFKAIIKFKDGLFYETEETSGSLLKRTNQNVMMFYCYEAPVPFWSRDNRLKVGKMNLPVDPKNVISARLHIKTWDGGKGEIDEPFIINGHAYDISEMNGRHITVHTVLDVNPAHLKEGENEISLLSDTEHHGIEILRPGPCLILRISR